MQYFCEVCMDGGNRESSYKLGSIAFEEKVYESSILIKGNYPKSSSMTGLSGHSHAGHF